MDKLLLAYYRYKPTIGYDEAPPGSDGIQKMFNWVGWIGVGICLVAVVLSGVAMAIGSRQGSSNEHMTKLGYALGGSIVVGSASAIVVAVTS
jgi:hypothetical protein